MSVPVYAGVFPIVPTTFGDDGSLDLASQRRALDFLIDAGVAGICILANFSEQFSLTDMERDQLTEVCLERVAGRVPVIVTTSHFSTRIATERSRRAQAAGASMVMVMPPYHGASMRAAPDQIRAYYASIAEAIDIPVMIQDNPLSGTNLPAAFLAELTLAHPTIAYFKLETDDAADKTRELIRLGGSAIVGPFDGEESITLITDLDAGATGTMPGGTVPDGLVPVVAAHAQGRRDEAVAAYERILPLINYENKHCGLRATKVLMKEGGVIASDATRHPVGPLSPAIRSGLLEVARRIDPLVMRWPGART